MKKLFIFFVFLIFMGVSFNANAQLTGIKTIPGNYPTIAAAIADLNSQGVGSGGVTFNVAAGHTETASNLLISIAANQPTAANPVVFQKSGAGANPLVTASPGTSPSFDGIIKLFGADYITFDGIDLLDPASNTGNAMMEWGYALMRRDSLDGSQNNVIKNCTITLQKISTISFGIYIVNRDTAGVVVTADDPAGQNSYNKLYGNTISNVYKGIVVISSSLARDINNEIGVNGLAANSITNWGGSTVSAEGIRCEGQVNVKINNNIVNGGAGTTGSAAAVGIIATLFGAGVNVPNYEISYNVVTVTASTSSQAHFGIRALATADTIRLHHNIVENCNAAQTTNGFNGLVHDPTGTTNAAYIHNNIVRNNTHSGTGTSTLLAGAGGGAITTLIMHSNEVYGNQKTGASGTMNCIQTADASLECYSNMVYNNSIPNSSGTSSSILYGYINSGTPVSEKVYNNTFNNLSVGGSGTSASSLVVGIRSNAAATTNKEFYRNQIYGLSGVSGSTTTGGVHGIYSTLGSSTKIHSNKIYNLTNSGATGSTSGGWVSSGTTIQIYNNFISGLNAPNSTNANGVIGINSTSTTANSTIGVYFNSIYLTAAGGSTFGSSGVSVTASATSTTAALDMRDNIIINLSTPGSTSGFTVAYRRSSVNLQSYAPISDYNIFHAGTPSANRLIFYDGTNSDQTLAAYQARVTPRDANSRSVLVNFVDPANGDLHLTGASIGDPDLLGTPIPGITNDIDGHIRSTTSPYKGADEPSTALVLHLRANLQACSPMPDTVTVLLRDTLSPYVIIDSARGVLDSNGEVKFNFANALNGVRYYIVVKHRNSIETWSKGGGEVFTAGVLKYDFTTAATQAFGNNQILTNGKWSIYTGDVQQDGIVDAADLSLIDNDAFIGATGYRNTDLNCDEFVDATDLSFADNNVFNGIILIRP